MVDSRATYIVVAAAPTPGPSPPAVSTTFRLGHTHTPSDPHITAGIAASRAEFPRFVTAAAAAGWTTTLPRQLSSRASVRERGEDGTERAQMRSAETGQLGERVVAGRRWRWGSHDSLGVPLRRRSPGGRVDQGRELEREEEQREGGGGSQQRPGRRAAPAREPGPGPVNPQRL